MERLKRSRGAHRAQITKLLQKGDGLLSTGDQMEEEQVDLLTATIDNLTLKLETLIKIDEKIMDGTTDDELEDVLIESDDYNISVREKLVRYKEFKTRILVTMNTDASNTSVNTSGSRDSFHPWKVNLPKLSIANFDGTIIKWQTFYDTFNSVIHTDPHLDDIKKFQYLQAQLTGEVQCTIAGLTLTSANYQNAMDLLQKRYGQPHKLISAHMRGLWELPHPSHELSSLRNFYDTLESQIRGLQALGKSENSYGDLLVPVILEKIPASMKVQITRDHGDSEWSLTDLRQAIL